MTYVKRIKDGHIFKWVVSKIQLKFPHYCLLVIERIIVWCEVAPTLLEELIEYIKELIDYIKVMTHSLHHRKTQQKASSDLPQSWLPHDNVLCLLFQHAYYNFHTSTIVRF